MPETREWSSRIAMMTTIHVELLDEGVRCWRPVEAEKLSDDTYRIVEGCLGGETWEFSQGDVVRCRPQMTDLGSQDRTLLGHTLLVAYELVSSS